MSEITDKSLLRCTLKKSADVTAKVVLYASYAVVGITATVLAIYGMIALYSVAINPIEEILNAIWNWSLPSTIYVVVISLITSIPWYVYAGIVAIAIIPIYSFLWCVARELTEEDWDLKKPYKRDISWYETILKVVTLPILIVEVVCTNEYQKTRKIVFFIGAYLHYRKRMREMKNNG